MLLQLVLAFAVAAPPQDTVAGRGTLSGTVHSEASGLPVSMAVVEVAADGGAVFRAITDARGTYRLQHVPAGRRIFRVRHLEHSPREMVVLVPARNEVVLDVSLEHRPIALATVQVVGLDERRESRAAEPADVAVIDHRALDNPGGAAGAGVVGPFAGAGELGEPDDVLYVRGSAADLQLVLLDGVPVYAPFHMGGLMDPFHTGALGSARLYLGGAPARYDGGLSYVMDLSTRAGDRSRHAASGALDMVSGRALIEGPLPFGAAYMAAARTVHSATLNRLEEGAFPYGYSDGLARVDVPVGSQSSISATAFTNSEAVRVDTLNGLREFARWNNNAGSIRLRGPLEGADAEATIAFGRYNALLPMRVPDQLLRLSADVDRLRLAADFSRMLGPIRLRYGGGHDRTWIRYSALEVEPDRPLMDTRSTGAVTGVYLDGTWQPDPRFVMRGGLRTDAFSTNTEVVAAPRLSATWLLTERAALTLAGGRYHQFVRIPRPLDPSPREEDIADRIPTILTVAGATHLSVSLDQQLTEGMRLGLEGYHKNFDGLPTTGGRSAFTSGMDVWVRRTLGDLTGWVGYSLSWSWSPPGPNESTDEFVGRQLLTLGASGGFARLADLGVRVSYGAGLPSIAGTELGSPARDALTGKPGGPVFTERVDLETEAPLTGHRADPYLRVDAQISRTWSPLLAGRRTVMTPYVRVINALDRRDSLLYRYAAAEEPGQRPNGIAAVPLLPVVGLTWHF